MAEQPQEALIGNRTAIRPQKKPLATAIAGAFVVEVRLHFDYFFQLHYIMI